LLKSLKIKGFAMTCVRRLAGHVATLAGMLSGCVKHLSRYLFVVAEHSGETINAPVLHRQTRASFGMCVESAGARMARSINGSGCRVRRDV
jgi:hypothetical protein